MSFAERCPRRRSTVIGSSHTKISFVQSNTQRLTIHKRDLQKPRESWMRISPQLQRKGVFPYLILIPHAEGQTQCITRSRFEWNNQETFDVSDQTWLLLVYPPLDRKVIWDIPPLAKPVMELPDYRGDQAVAVLLTFRKGLKLQSCMGQFTLMSTDSQAVGTVGFSTAFDGLFGLHNADNAIPQSNHRKFDPANNLAYSRADILDPQASAHHLPWDITKVIARAKELSSLFSILMCLNL